MTGPFPPNAAPISSLHARGLIAGVVLAFSLIAAASGKLCRAQDAAPACTSVKGGYRCSIEGLKSSIALAKTFAVKTSPRDRVGAAQIQSFGVSLGKSLALANQPADLTFELAGTETDGVNYGQMDRELATLKVFTNSGRTLGWVETISDQPDLPWAAVVRRLVEQLREKIR